MPHLGQQKSPNVSDRALFYVMFCSLGIALTIIRKEFLKTNIRKWVL